MRSKSSCTPCVGAVRDEPAEIKEIPWVSHDLEKFQLNAVFIEGLARINSRLYSSYEYPQDPL